MLLRAIVGNTLAPVVRRAAGAVSPSFTFRMSSSAASAATPSPKLSQHEKSLFIDPNAPVLPRKEDQGYRFGVQAHELEVRAPIQSSENCRVNGGGVK